MKKVSGILLCVVVLFCFHGKSIAYNVPYNITNLSAFLDDPTYFNGFTAIEDYNFSGLWSYTAIASEAGSTNVVADAINGIFTFTAADQSNWGLWNTVDFSSQNLFFTDQLDSSPENILIGFNDGYFQLFQLTEDSNLLNYLAYPIILPKGTYILGFNDNVYPPGGDLDYDDLVIAMNDPPATVPEPTTMLLLAFGLFSLAGFRMKFKRR